MVETLEMAPATAGEACFADEVLLLELTSDPYHPSVAELKHQAQILQEFFEPSVEGLPGLPTEGKGGGDEEEEELEWLANKDAFPALETSFETPSRPRTGSGGSEGWDGATVGAVAERKSPVSVFSAATSFSAPVRPRSKGRRPRRRVLTGLSPEPPTVAVAGKSTAVERRRCRHCEAEETPQWRAGPEGPKTLCNACGVRYKSGRLVPEYRPASSPTFSPANHSNFHRQILEMRRQRSTRQRRSAGAPPPAPLVNSPVM
ncbi:GATA transcription factor 1-like [Musa acuminata AAA Group]|uniref:GATA transcription factor 1-like n=1 Tax=Musa acuminata AAA Group TaxID=214697 RepID=UPI0031D77EDE